MTVFTTVGFGIAHSEKLLVDVQLENIFFVISEPNKFYSVSLILLKISDSTGDSRKKESPKLYWLYPAGDITPTNTTQRVIESQAFYSPSLALPVRFKVKHNFYLVVPFLS